MGNSEKPYKKKNFWKSLKDYYDDPEILKAKANEFQDGVTDDFDPSKLSGLSRRKFLALMSASAAFAATACSDYRDQGEIIPYNKRPEEILQGHANFYASTCNGCANSCGILIKTREGRPIKIDGNPDHPINKGKICTKGQASIYNLYDPARLTDPKYLGRNVEWKDVDNEIIEALNSAQSSGKEIALVTGAVTSPTYKKLLNDFKAKYSNAKIYSINLLNDEQRKQAWKESYGTEEYPAVKFDEANVILSLDSDFLVNEGNSVENIRKFSAKREVVNGTSFNRFYAAEGRLSATGAMADYRLRISPAEQLDFVMFLISKLLVNSTSVLLDSNSINKINKYSNAKFAGAKKEIIDHLIQDLNENKGRAIVYAGDTLSKDVHTAVNLLNEIIDGTNLYDYSKVFKSLHTLSSTDELKQLTSSMKNGSVGVLIHLDTNPVYHLPSDLDYAGAIKNVQTVISFTELENETSALSKYVLPINNQLESWGDAYVRGGVYSLQQPVIAPIFNTRQKEAVLLTWLNGDSASYNEKIYNNYLIDFFNAEIYAMKNPLTDARNFWLSALHDGVVVFDEIAGQNKFSSASFAAILDHKKKDGYVVHLSGSYFTGDGSFANNGWLQETPHPVTKVTWDNYAAISPATAKKYDVEMNDIIEVTAGGKKIKLPVVVQPGNDDNTINIELGYGRTVTGEVGINVGVNAISLMSNNYSGSPFIIEGASISKTGDTYKLMSTQEHHALDDTFTKDFHRIRKIIQEGTVKQYQNNPHFLKEGEAKHISITKDIKYTGNKWAMAIDLNKCTSCSACISSCNVENNVPVVGKDQVERGREMQWMRIDRYYSGTPEEPIVSNQPMLCQHCDNAPCENVCPVNATNHSPDGLNQMAYNRCVGTRYCANNCPYKVRRFNFYNFRDHFADAYYENNLTVLVNNPEVTVRSSGVMEKCTFCVQRIMEERTNAIKEGREVIGENIVTACQQACPANAIVFGDANDPNSAVAKLRDHNLSYHVLEELNVKPNVTYIAKLRNTHSEEIA